MTTDRAHLALAPSVPPSVHGTAADVSAEHVLDMYDTGCTLLHPVTCRPALFDCPVTHVCYRLTEPPCPLGKWVCHLTGDGLLVIDRVADENDLAACGAVVTVDQVCTALGRVDWNQVCQINPETGQLDIQRRRLAEQIAAAVNGHDRRPQ